MVPPLFDKFTTLRDVTGPFASGRTPVMNGSGKFVAQPYYDQAALLALIAGNPPDLSAYARLDGANDQSTFSANVSAPNFYIHQNGAIVSDDGGYLKVNNAADGAANFYNPVAFTLATETEENIQLQVVSDTVLVTDRLGVGLSSASSVSNELLAVLGSGSVYNTITTSSAGEDAKRWAWVAFDDGRFEGQAINDAFGDGRTWMKVQRTGYEIDSVVFPESAVGVGGTPDHLLTATGAGNAFVHLNATSGVYSEYYGTDIRQAGVLMTGGAFGDALLTLAGSNYGGLDTAVAGDFVIATRSGGRMLFSTDPAYQRIDMAIDSAGNLGVGTGAPVIDENERQMTLRSETGNVRINLQGHQDNDSYGLSILTAYNDSTMVGLLQWLRNGETGSDFTLYTGKEGSIVLALSANADGKVGVKTPSPAYDLDVAGDINFTGNLYQNGVEWTGGGGGTPSLADVLDQSGDAANQSILNLASASWWTGSNYTAVYTAMFGQSTDLNLYLPPDAGSPGFVFTTDGSGNTAWAAAPWGETAGADVDLNGFLLFGLNVPAFEGADPSSGIWAGAGNCYGVLDQNAVLTAPDAWIPMQRNGTTYLVPGYSPGV